MKTHYYIKAVMLMVLMSMASVSKSDHLINSPANTISHKENAEKERAEKLLKRLEDIRDMDKNNLSKAEKRSLRKEVREIKKELATISGGVYISVGALLLILILLILLL